MRRVMSPPQCFYIPLAEKGSESFYISLHRIDGRRLVAGLPKRQHIGGSSPTQSRVLVEPVCRKEA